VFELAVAFRKDSTYIRSDTGEEKLVCQAHINNADEEQHHGDMRDPVTLQTEASFQARIKELEDANRALVVSVSVIKASKQPDQTEIRRLQRKNDVLEGRLTTNREHYHAEMERLDEKNETLAKEKDDETSLLRKEYSDVAKTRDAILERAKSEWDSHAACISKLQEDKSTLTKGISDRDAAMKSKDDSISTLEETSRDRELLYDISTAWNENDKKLKDELKEQVRDL
jgi:hypothetical protein